MSTRRIILRNLVASMVVLVGGGISFAADVPSADHAAPTKEMREKMATLHEQMAACLRSDKPIADCRSEMKKSCSEALGKEGCPMMDRMHHHMMKKESSVPPKE